MFLGHFSEPYLVFHGTNLGGQIGGFGRAFGLVGGIAEGENDWLVAVLVHLLQNAMVEEATDAGGTDEYGGLDLLDNLLQTAHWLDVGAGKDTIVLVDVALGTSLKGEAP